MHTLILHNQDALLTLSFKFYVVSFMLKHKQNKLKFPFDKQICTQVNVTRSENLEESFFFKSWEKLNLKERVSTSFTNILFIH